MLLGLDLGTTNVKAIVTDTTGRVLGSGAAPVQLFHLANGGVEQDLEEIWSATLSAIRQAVTGLDAASVRAVGVSSQGGAMQLIDAHRRPHGRVLSWLDGRGAADDERLTRELGRDWFVHRIVRGGSGLAVGQLARLAREDPAALRSPNRVGFVGDLIVERLCGQARHDGTSAALTLLYNPRLRTYDPDLLRRLALDAGQLPRLQAPTLPAGELLAAVADATGLAPGIPVSPAVHDQYAATLGNAAVHPGDVMVGTGTAWVLLAVSRELPPPAIDNALICHHVVDGLAGQILSLHNGGSALTWALRALARETANAADLDQRLAAVPPGSDGLRVWPFFAATPPSRLSRNPGARFEGLQFAHTPAHLIRGVVEGLVFELYRHLQFLGEGNAAVLRLLLSGGAAQSAVTPQIIADVTGLPVICRSDSQASLRGAVVLARALIESNAGLARLSSELTSSGRLIEPGANSAQYQSLAADYRASLAHLIPTR